MNELQLLDAKFRGSKPKEALLVTLQSVVRDVLRSWMPLQRINIFAMKKRSSLHLGKHSAISIRIEDPLPASIQYVVKQVIVSGRLPRALNEPALFALVDLLGAAISSGIGGRAMAGYYLLYHFPFDNMPILDLDPSVQGKAVLAFQDAAIPQNSVESVMQWCENGVKSVTGIQTSSGAFLDRLRDQSVVQNLQAVIDVVSQLQNMGDR